LLRFLIQFVFMQRVYVAMGGLWL